VTSAGRLRIFAGQRALAEFPAMRPIAFSPDGQQLLVVAGAQVRLLDVSE